MKNSRPMVIWTEKSCLDADISILKYKHGNKGWHVPTEFKRREYLLVFSFLIAHCLLWGSKATLFLEWECVRVRESECASAFKNKRAWVSGMVWVSERYSVRVWVVLCVRVREIAEVNTEMWQKWGAHYVFRVHCETKRLEGQRLTRTCLKINTHTHQPSVLEWLTCLSQPSIIFSVPFTI